MPRPAPKTQHPAPAQWAKTGKTKTEAAALLGISEKAVERASQRAVDPIRSAWRQEPGRRSYRVYHPEDLAKLRRALPRQVTGELVPAGKTANGALETALHAVNGTKLVVQVLPAPRLRPVMTVAEVAEELGVSRALVKRAVAEGELPSFRDGHVRVFRSAAEAWLARLETACRQGGF